MKRILRNNLSFLFFLIIVGVAIYTFYDLPRTFFQQDEWHNFGYVMLHKGNFWEIFFADWKRFLLGLGRPLSMFLNFQLFKIFGIKAFNFAFFAIILHMANTLLVFYLILSLTKSKFSSLLGALLFLTNSISHQAVTWLGTVSGTLPSSLFALLSFIFFLRYLEKEKIKLIIYSIAFLVVSILFKESSIFLFLFFPLFSLIWRKKKVHQVFLPIFAVIVFFYLPFLLYGGKPDTFIGTPSLANSSGTFYARLLYNIFVYPIQSLSLIFIHPSFIYRFTGALTKAKFPNYAGDGLVEQTIIAEFVSLFFGILFLLILFIFFKSLLKQRRERNVMLTSISYIILSSLPFVILEKSTPYFESRSYYLIAFGGALLFGQVIALGASFLKRRYKNPLIYLLILFFSIWYLYTQANFIKKDIGIQLAITSQRKQILGVIRTSYPDIGQKPVFYTESDTTYLDPKEKILPFQSGFGQTLMVVYAAEKKVDPKLFAEDFLWGIYTTGYKEVDSNGFGYFRDYPTLLKALEDNGLSSENVYAFHWDGERLTDITKTVRRRLNNEL